MNLKKSIERLDTPRKHLYTSSHQLTKEIQTWLIDFNAGSVTTSM